MNHKKPVHAVMHGAVRKRQNKFNDKFQTEYIAMHSSNVELSKVAIQCMFFANGGAVTALLINFDVSKFIIPILTFSIAIVYVVLLTIVMIFRCTSSFENYLKFGINPVIYWHKSLLHKYLCGIAICIPAILFFCGMVLCMNIFDKTF